MRTSVKTIAPTGRIGEPLPCIKCGYRLQGLSIATSCPECNEPVRSTLAALSLEQPDYAVGGLRDYGLSMKLAALAPAGAILVGVLGPMAAVVVASAGFVRVSGTGRILRSGLGGGAPLRTMMRSAHRLAWVSAVFGALVALALLHDAIGRWGVWLTGPQALALAFFWSLIVTAELLLGARIVLHAARIVDVTWVTVAARTAATAFVIGVLLQVLLGVLLWSTAAAPRWVVVTQVLLLAIPIIGGGVVLGGLMQRLGDVADDLHWATASESPPSGE